MSERDKILRDTFERVCSLLDQAMHTKAGGDSLSNQLLLWKAAAETEYLAFQISMIHGLGDLEVKSNKAGAEISVKAARKFIEDAQSSIQSNPSESYRAVRGAVGVLRKTQLATEGVAKSQPTHSPKNE